MEMHSEGGQGHAARVLARTLERELADLHRDWQSERDAHGQAYEAAMKEREDNARAFVDCAKKLFAAEQDAERLAGALEFVLSNEEHRTGSEYKKARAALAAHRATQPGKEEGKA
jgi:lipase chaperone LimK